MMGKMKEHVPKESPLIGMAQMEIEPGAPALNGARMLEILTESGKQGVDLLVFPELCIPGYLLGDTWERPAFLRECQLWTERIIAATATAGPAVVFGTVVADWMQTGEDGRVRKYNSYIVAQNGQAIVQPGLKRPYGIKTLLPNYREFEESRHFYDTRKLALETGVAWESLLEPVPVELKGQAWKVGVLLCEDAWQADYAQKPMEVLGTKSCDFLLNLSCSPYTQGKNDKRNRVFADQVRKLGIPLFYVNAVSLQNNGKTLYTFDGRSTVYGANGSIYAEMPAYEDGLLTTPLDMAGSMQTGPDSKILSKSKEKAFSSPHIQEIHQALVYGARRFMASMGQSKVVIGVSGGIDSAVAAALYREILPPENLLLINMPSRFNSATTRNLARTLSLNLGCFYAEISIEESFNLTQTQIHGLKIQSGDGGLKSTLHLKNLGLENIQSRDRGGRILPAVAAAFGGVFTCNANKSELTVGYTTFYGDLGGYLALLGDLWKGEVYALGRYLNEEIFKYAAIPEGCFTIVPSAELSANQAVDEGKGDPLIYPYHDRLFYSWVQRWNRATPEEILEWYAAGTLNQNLACDGIDAYALFPTAEAFILDLEKWWELYNGVAVAKRVQAPPILAVSTRAFGFDHRDTLGRPFLSTRYRELRSSLLKPLA